MDIGCIRTLVAFSFPSKDGKSLNAQFQAISGLRGLAINNENRKRIVQDGGLEPLILSATLEAPNIAIEVRREVGATFCNLALATENKAIMSKAGVIPALIKLALIDDDICQTYSVAALANLAELEGNVQKRMLDEGCLKPLLHIAGCSYNTKEVHKEVARCLTLFTCNKLSHSQIVQNRCFQKILNFLNNEKNIVCQRFASLAIGNLAVFESNHMRLFESGAVSSLLKATKSKDMHTKQCVAFALSNLTRFQSNHRNCEKIGVVQALICLLGSSDPQTKFQSCLATRFLCMSSGARIQFVQSNGLSALLAFAKTTNVDYNREATATLKNISLFDPNKIAIIKEGGFDILISMCHDSDCELSHQACGVLANLAEASENRGVMLKRGILQHLKFSLRSDSVNIKREAIRAIANLASSTTHTAEIVTGGTLDPLISALSLKDSLCKRFATMGIANLATNIEIQEYIVEADAIAPLVTIVGEKKGDLDAKCYGLFCLTNMAAAKKNHVALIKYGLIKIVCHLITCKESRICKSALQCIANLASNSSNHVSFLEEKCIQNLLSFLSNRQHDITFQSVLALRGFSTSYAFRTQIIQSNGLEPLLKLCCVDSIELQMEVIATLCNLSLEGFLGKEPNKFLSNIDLDTLISFLCNSDSTYRLFGALSIGNIVCDENLHKPIIKSGVINSMLNVANSVGIETHRSIAYAICNLVSIKRNRPLVLSQGGLPPLIFLSCSNDPNDNYAGLATLRGLASDQNTRRMVFQAGALQAISRGAECLANSKCQVEAASLLCALSLNEENKVDIANARINHIINLLLNSEDVMCCIMTARAFANVCENESLHERFIQENCINHLINLLFLKNIDLTKEVARCLSNFAANHLTHDILNQEDVPIHMTQICSSNDLLSKSYALIGLMNLSMKPENRKKMNVDEFVNVLCNTLHINEYVKNNCKDPNVSISQDQLRCIRYACLAIGGMCCSTEIHSSFIDKNIISSLIDTFPIKDEEYQLYLSFVINKLASNSLNFESMRFKKLIEHLIGLARRSDRNTKTHAISSLRKLSVDNDYAEDILELGGLDALAEAYVQDYVESRREIAACLCHLTMFTNIKIVVLKSMVLEPLLSLCQSSDSEVARFALGAVANIAEHLSSHQVLIEQKNSLHFLLLSARSRRVVIHREATRAISNLLSYLDAHKVFWQENGITIFSALSHSSDFECQYNIALSFRKLATNIKNHDFLATEDSIKSMIRLAQCQQPNSQLQAASALRDIAANHNMKLDFVHKGGLTAAISMLNDQTLNLRIIAMNIFHHLSLSTRLRRMLMDEGAFVPICDICVSHNDHNMLFQCAGILANLCECEHQRETLIAQGILDHLIKLAQYPVDAILCFTARAFSFLSATSENTHRLIEKETVQTLFSLLSNEEEECGKEAGAALSNIAVTEENQLFIAQLGGFEPLIRLLDSKFMSVQRSVCQVLHKLSIPTANKKQIINKGGLPKLIHLLHSTDPSICLASIMVICNVSTHKANHEIIIKQGGLQPLIALLWNKDKCCQKAVLKTLCNLSRSERIQEHIVNIENFHVLFELTRSDDAKCVELAGIVICNIAINRKNYATVLDRLQYIIAMVSTSEKYLVQRVAILILYNISAFERSLFAMINYGVTKSIIPLCDSKDLESKQYAIMLLSNLAANIDTRKDATRGGGLQAAIRLLKDVNIECNRYACICLANMSNCKNMQRQIVVHGGLPHLINHICSSDIFLKRYSIMCLVNLCATEANHHLLSEKAVLENVVRQFHSNEIDIKESCGFALANLCSNDDILNKIGDIDSIEPLFEIASSKNLHIRCLGLFALKKLSKIAENRKRLIDAGILIILSNSSNSTSFEIQREVAACFCFLSSNSSVKKLITQNCAPCLKCLASSKDSEAARLSAGTFANILEDIESHDLLHSQGALECIKNLVHHESIDVHREASRALCNMLTSDHLQNEIVDSCFEAIFLRSSNADSELQYYLSISLRKLGGNTKSSDIIRRKGFSNIFELLKSDEFATQLNAATAIRDLCANNDVKVPFARDGGIDQLVEVSKRKDNKLQILTISSLRHLSLCDVLKEDIVKSGALQICIRCISYATEDLKCQVAGLISNLSECTANHTSMLQLGVMSCIVSLVKSDNSEIKQVR